MSMSPGNVPAVRQEKRYADETDRHSSTNTPGLIVLTLPWPVIHLSSLRETTLLQKTW
jgi:hypothetical protein